MKRFSKIFSVMLLKNANPQTMRSVLGKLIEIGADIKTEKESISLNICT
jgi:UDP-N-acetylglucosamine enolpyruvyl transferase